MNVSGTATRQITEQPCGERRCCHYQASLPHTGRDLTVMVRYAALSDAACFALSPAPRCQIKEANAEITVWYCLPCELAEARRYVHE